MHIPADIAEMLGVTPPVYAYDDSFDPDEDDDIKLLMPHPYDDVYLWYLCAMIDLMQEDTNLYEVDAAQFNALWERAQAWYRRHNPYKCKKNWKVM